MGRSSESEGRSRIIISRIDKERLRRSELHKPEPHIGTLDRPSNKPDPPNQEVCVANNDTRSRPSS